VDGALKFCVVHHHVQFEDWVPFPLSRVFLFFADPNNLPRIMPSQTATRIDSLRLMPPPERPGPTNSATIAGVGSEIDTSFRVIPDLFFRAGWTARITEFEWNHHFADVQVKGPFRSWHHRHEFGAEDRNGVQGTVVRDLIEYSVGFGIFGNLVQELFVESQLRQTFQCRQKALPKLLAGA
jgi:ligand-binding SRPBCC domain-containing protein